MSSRVRVVPLSATRRSWLSTRAEQMAHAAVHPAEHADVGADAEAEREHGDARERRLAHHQPPAVADVLRDHFESPDVKPQPERRDAALRRRGRTARRGRRRRADGASAIATRAGCRRAIAAASRGAATAARATSRRRRSPAAGEAMRLSGISDFDFMTSMRNFHERRARPASGSCSAAARRPGRWRRRR